MISQAEKPCVSVIVPTFNRAWILKEAIDSVLAQNYRDFELIVIDDGSTDHTRDILHPYRDRLTVIRQANAGVSAARNRGIRAASGRLIAFLDSDDLWLPGKLERQTAFFDATPEAMVCRLDTRISALP